MIETQVKHISSTHSFGIHKFSLSGGPCITHTEDLSAEAEAIVGNHK